MPAPSDPATALSPTDCQRPFVVQHWVRQRRCFEVQPPIPLLPVTRLRLDLQLNQTVMDLQAIVAVVLSDVGATLQILRATARAHMNPDWRAGRIADCVVHLGRKCLTSALSLVMAADAKRRNESARQLWKRARLTAELSKLLAGNSPEIDPVDAYLAGLLHEAGRIPATLGWRVEGIDLEDSSAVGRALVREWRLPAFLESTMLPASGCSDSCCRLRNIVAAAWELANAIRSGQVNSEQVPRPIPRLHAPPQPSPTGWSRPGIRLVRSRRIP